VSGIHGTSSAFCGAGKLALESANSACWVAASGEQRLHIVFTHVQTCLRRTARSSHHDDDPALGLFLSSQAELYPTHT
jgi:hypothetical protein